MTLSISVKFLATIASIYGAFLISPATSQCPQVIITERRPQTQLVEFDEDYVSTCSKNEFECRNGDCIQGEFLCDGIADCSDQSDETWVQCTKSELNCPSWAFRCDYGACVSGNAICDGVKDCLDNSDELLPECPRRAKRRRGSVVLGYYDEERDPEITRPRRRRVYKWRIPSSERTLTPASRSSLRPLTALRTDPDPTPSLMTFMKALGSFQTPLYSFCIVPSQPLNGHWRLHRSFCKSDEHCDIPQGVALELGSQLVYACVPDFRARGNTDVFCGSGGKWSPIPVCIATTCAALNTVSRSATCTRFGERVSCRAPVLPFTRARVTCRINYGQERTYSTAIEQDVECGLDGRWDPEPVTCSPVCGLANSAGQRKDSVNGILTEVGAFPWHANLWRVMDTPQGPQLAFRCSATIIGANFVLTAAHCVLNERLGTGEDPGRLRVTAGNTYQQSDGAQNAPWIVQKVKNVHRYCDYYGLAHSYASDIALVELWDPFEFSTVVLPACLDVSGHSEDAFRPGATGKIDGYGRNFVDTPRPILQTVKVTHVPNAECRIPLSFPQVGNDEFCAVYSNETRVCDWDSGGGLVAKKEGLWHLRGVFSIGLGVGPEAPEPLCGENPYSLYTKVSAYMAWIQDVLFQLERYKSYPLCSAHLPPLVSTSTAPPLTEITTRSTATSDAIRTPTTTTSTPSPVDTRTSPSVSEFSCLVPPQPANGKWRLHQSLCADLNNCEIPDGAVLGPGSQLVYTCATGFKIQGRPDVFCGAKGRWSAIPSCIGITCSSLESVSRMVTCFRSNNWVPCNTSALPETRAVISCRLGYREDTSVLKTGSKTVECNENGEWEPNPIACLPLCGVTNSHLTPTILNGTAANIPDFPWHATLYKQSNSSHVSKEFICGATIIQNNLLLTAAHCVYDDAVKAIEIPEKFHVAAGNTFRDYDSPLHDPRVVQKSAVKNVYVPCEYYGIEGNYGSDIALIELREPFQLSNILLPACLDVLGNSEQILEPGATGRFAGFGRTQSGKSSATLLSTKIPYVSYSQCKMSQDGGDTVGFIGFDKFCGGTTNGMAVCLGDSGGGLAFDNGGKWDVLGVLSVNLGVETSNGERTCDGTAYSLYTKVSTHMPWIRDVMYHLERDKTYPSCGSA